ncbi:MAG: HD domain-containing phosphohydrolase [Gammaproteobacteria bacterium]
MANIPPPRLIPVDCARLQLGMYVAELDRSWLHTTFHAHGFLLSQPEQIAELQSICAYVYVDPALSEHDEGETGIVEEFGTGLTSCIAALSTSDIDTPVARQRRELHELGHVFADAVQELRQARELPITRLRRALEPVVTSLLADTDTLPWLIATELKVAFLYRRAIGSAVLMAMAGQKLGFGHTTISELALAGLLLDIGKVSVPVTILAKCQPLTGHERQFVERHVRRGLYMVRSAAVLPESVEDAVLGHHERLDGSGYPRGLHGTQLPLPARLAGVVDTYDAMLQDRRYARAVAPHDAMRVVNGLSERKFDTAIVRSFMRTLGLYPTGSWLQISDGRLGVVRWQVPDAPTRPLIAILSDSAGRALPTGPMLWQPARRGDILRALRADAVTMPQHQLDQSLRTASDLAA